MRPAYKRNDSLFSKLCRIMMPMKVRIRSAKDLITPPSSTRRGFIDQALQKHRIFEPWIRRAEQLRTVLDASKSLSAVTELAKQQPEILMAAGISDKAARHLRPHDREEIMESVVHAIEASGLDDWRNELIGNFLLTAGDAAGGRIRNWIGNEAKRRLSDAVRDRLQHSGIQAHVKFGGKHKDKVVLLTWSNRAIVFDVKIGSGVNKNVDAVLIEAGRNGSKRAALTTVSAYLAMGELKGGYDPAGSDEHWKTANHALERVRQKLHPRPKLFFVGAAIVEGVAEEIYSDLQSQRLDFAANLTNHRQLTALADWLISL